MTVFSSISKTLCNSIYRKRPKSCSVLTLLKCMSNVPENRVYGGPKSQNPNQRVTLTQLGQKYENGQPITMVTAYDYPSGVHFEWPELIFVLWVILLLWCFTAMIPPCPYLWTRCLCTAKQWGAGAKSPLLVGNLFFISYESSTHQAVETTVRVLKEGGTDAIKLEAGVPSRITAAKAIVEAGIAVMGHVGLTPQATSVLGGFRPQDQSVASAVNVF